MKKKWLIIIIFSLFFMYKNTYAFDSSNYRYRPLCGNYEVSAFHSDGGIISIKCFGDYYEAKNYMVNDGAEDLVIMTNVNGESTIIDANVALLDLSVNPETLTYFYGNSDLTGYTYTYMDTGSLYGGVDGVHMDTGYSNTYGTWTAKVQIGNYIGWIKKSAYEIVPITWVRSSSSYTVTDDIRHNYVAKIQNEYWGNAGRIIGPKPEMLNKGTYYSYDGHYFYTDLRTLIRDVKNNSHNNSVNKDKAYYNYYMYLSNHTKTAYSSINIDEYIRNNMGMYENVYGNAAASGTSRLYGSGTFFYYAQQKYGVNAILSLSLSRNETGNGTSNLAINKNNGFGLNAVDSNPTQAANWYPTFNSSILGYASKWITYGYAHPRDWRYFGPQFGDKWIGMNVKYASDTYWSEKMASNYYSLDKAFGLQDYNYYQLGVVNGPTYAYSDASTSSKFIYEYPEKEDGVVIVDEVVRNNEKWYKVVSDLNIDNNYNELPEGSAYNWNAYVYVKANQVTKINNGKNGYINPNSVTEYLDYDYNYDLLVENAELKPRVAITTKNSNYYYDSSLQSKTNKTVLKDRYVMVYAIAYENNMAVSYLITSDYFHDQKHWVSADSIKFTNTNYGKVSVTVSGNQYTWVNYNTEDKAYSKISGLYTNSYVPVLESLQVGSDTWLKVPVNLTGNDNVYGYTLKSFPGVSITLSTPIVENTLPVINAKDITIMENTNYDPKENVTATDAEDGDLTNKIEIISNVDTTKPGEYYVTYKVKDSNNSEVEKTIKVTVKENKAPVINANNLTISIKDTYDPLKNVTATDTEDGDLTSKIKVIKNTVKQEAGEYEVTYEVEDNNHKKTTKTIKVTVVKNQLPVINANDQVVFQNEDFNPLNNVTATDFEDGDLTNKIKVTENTVNTKELGTYKVTYEVIDSSSEKTTKTIKVEVKEKILTESAGEFYLDNLSWNKTNKYFTISGYLIILNHNNTNSKKYELIFKDKNTNKEYSKEITSWLKDTPYDLGSENNNSYTSSWFKGKIDFKNIPYGDYELFMKATDKEYYTIQTVDNLFNKPINKRGEDSNGGYNFKVLLNLKSKKMEIGIREELYTTYEAPTFRTMVNDFEEIKWNNNKLYILGYSYNYDATYKSSNDITRTLIVENTSTYKQYYFDLGSKKGPYEITTSDNKDKSYIWYEKEIDLSKLEKGTYSIQIYTKTSDARDYGELTDILGILPNTTTTINNKKYTLKLNKERLNRVEIVVE